jgi:hypothetical protein
VKRWAIAFKAAAFSLGRLLDPRIAMACFAPLFIRCRKASCRVPLAIGPDEATPPDRTIQMLR